MPGAPFHDRQVAHNEEFFASIDSGKFADWVTTTLFYGAVHLWMGYQADVHGKTDCRSHAETGDDMDADPRLPESVRHAYEELKDRSWTARYYKWEADSYVVNVMTESLPLYSTFKDWAAAQRASG